MIHPAFRGVRLSPSDTPAGLALSTEAGWNQVEADWHFMLREGVGFGFEDSNGRLVASALVIPYGQRFAWIGMVLVSAAARRQGLATLLLRHALELGRQRQWALLLDATAEGRKVYLPLGFRDLRSITRWTCGQPRPVPHSFPSEVVALDLTDDWVAWDAGSFGASRRALLREMHSHRPQQAWQYGQPRGAIHGFCLTRAGRLATQLGPLVASHEITAATLLSTALDQATGAQFVDLVDGREKLEACLRLRGFAPARHFIRMIHGPAAEPGRPESIFAITGPEFG